MLPLISSTIPRLTGASSCEKANEVLNSILEKFETVFFEPTENFPSLSKTDVYIRTRSTLTPMVNPFLWSRFLGMRDSSSGFVCRPRSWVGDSFVAWGREE